MDCFVVSLLAMTKKGTIIVRLCIRSGKLVYSWLVIARTEGSWQSWYSNHHTQHTALLRRTMPTHRHCEGLKSPWQSWYGILRAVHYNSSLREPKVRGNLGMGHYGSTPTLSLRRPKACGNPLFIE